MVGRVHDAYYRRGLNLLSRANYNQRRDRYMQIRIQPIVAFATGQYHSTVSRENQSDDQ
jgi:hypothetical protein